MDNAIIVVTISSSVTVVAVLITGFLNLRTNKLARKNEHKLAILKVLLEAGYKEYEFRAKQSLEAAVNPAPKILSFTEFIIFYKEMAEVFSKEEVTKNDIIDSLKKNKELIDTYYTNRDLLRPEYHSR